MFFYVSFAIHNFHLRKLVILYEVDELEKKPRKLFVISFTLTYNISLNNKSTITLIFYYVNNNRFKAPQKKVDFIE
jgi:hypothetical protein